jgi:hypothetical protein
MALSSAERQAKRRAKLKAEGKMLFQSWVTPSEASKLRSVLAGSANAEQPPQPTATRDERIIPAVLAIGLPRRQGPTLDSVSERNAKVFEEHQDEIRARLDAGWTVTQVAAWLNTRGFVGTGQTVENFLKTRVWY